LKKPVAVEAASEQEMSFEEGTGILKSFYYFIFIHDKRLLFCLFT
jgi:hypothetical protein